MNKGLQSLLRKGIGRWPPKWTSCSSKLAEKKGDLGIYFLFFFFHFLDAKGKQKSLLERKKKKKTDSFSGTKSSDDGISANF